MKLLLVLSAVAAALHAVWSAVGWPAVPFLTGLEYIPERLADLPCRDEAGRGFQEG